MKLQILIPQYNETDEIIKPLLDSIAIQQGINFNDIGVIIVNDGSDVELSDFIFNYPFQVLYFKHNHLGVSATRNRCFELSSSPYVMFCDADDMFYSIQSINIILTNINNGFETLMGKFIEEGRDKNNNPIFIPHNRDSVFVHGKVHNREFLINNKIQFLPQLTIHEDSYFNIQCHELAKEVLVIEEPIYLWKWRKDSICRKDPKYIFKTYTNLIDSNDALITAFFQREKQDLTQKYTCQAILEAYYTMQKPEWNLEENKEYKDKTEKYFALFWKKWHKFWELTNSTEKTIYSNKIRERHINEGMKFEFMTFSQWINYIESLLKNQD